VSPSELDEVLTVLRRHGVTRAVIGDVEVELLARPPEDSPHIGPRPPGVDDRPPPQTPEEVVQRVAEELNLA